MTQFSIEITANAVAWYGAIVATIGIIISLLNFGLNFWKERVRIKIKVTQGFHTLGGPVSEICLFVEAMNVGWRPATLNTAGFELDDGSNLILTRTAGEQLPYELREGKSHMSYVEKEKIVETLKESGRKLTYAWYTTATGKIYKTRKNVAAIMLKSKN
ncbi:MAG: hypothetical protein ABSE76_01465 [Minisyncoccia bacterium]|jgi:hypothetical protein